MRLDVRCDMVDEVNVAGDGSGEFIGLSLDEFALIFPGVAQRVQQAQEADLAGPIRRVGSTCRP